MRRLVGRSCWALSILGSLLGGQIALEAQTQGAWDGAMSAIIAKVEISRRGETYPARYHAGLRSGDRVVTGPDGAASFFLTDQGAFIYLGPSSSLLMSRHDDHWTLRLEQGEMRVTNDREPEVTLVTATAEARFSQGILRMAVSSKGTRLWT